MSTQAPANVRQLANDLATRLNGELAPNEPYVLQDRVPQTRSRHVVVIWDAWADFDRLARSQIIAMAYREAGIDDAINVALGLTQEEALNMGYLPYTIVANWKQADGKQVFESLKSAAQRAPGVHVRTGSSLQLRYPSLQHAQAAYRILSAEVPGPYWTIVKEESASE